MSETVLVVDCLELPVSSMSIAEEGIRALVVGARLVRLVKLAAGMTAFKNTETCSVRSWICLA